MTGTAPTGPEQTISGKDNSTGFTWPITAFSPNPALDGIHTIPPSSSSDANNLHFFNIVNPPVVHSGSQALQLNMVGYPQGSCCAQNVLNMVGMSQPITSFYERVWVYLGTEINSQLATYKGNFWRDLFEMKTTSDYRIITYVYGDSSGNPYWHIQADNNANNTYPPSGTMTTFWQTSNTTVPVPIGQWFLEEIYLKRSTGSDGQFFFAVNGQTLINHMGPNYGSNNEQVNQWMIQNEYGPYFPQLEYLDDLELWSAPPCATLPCGAGGGSAPTITTSSPLNNGTVGVAFSQTLTATGSTPITWALASGALPPGETLNTSSGTISGTPTASGTYTFGITASNSSGTTTPTTFTQQILGNFTSDAYIAQSMAGVGNGTSCANALPGAYFNSAADWGSGAGKIGPGVVVHVCGTWTGPAGGTLLTFQGSGTASLPITLRFESGASMSAPYWGTLGAITANGKSNIVIDGGTNGTIANTANGTALANHQTSTGVNLVNCTQSEVKNLTVHNIYVNQGSSSGATDTAGQNTTCIVFTTNSTSNKADGNTVSQCKTGIQASMDSGGDASNLQIFNNTISDMDWGINVGGGSAGDTATNLQIYGNSITNWTNWQFPTSAYHQDGIILFNVGNSTAGIIAQIYNNHIFGDMGVGSPTGMIYCADFSSCTVYNNILNNTGHVIDGIIWLGQTTNLGKTMAVYNNTIVSTLNDIGITLALSGHAVIENNIVQGVMVGIHDYKTITTTVTTSNNNVWQTTSGTAPQMATNDSTFLTYTTWRGDGYDAASATTSANLNSSFQPQSGSSAIGLGANLTSLNIVPLQKDYAGTMRPTTGPWTSGVYQVAGGPTCTINTSTLPGGTVGITYTPTTLSQSNCNPGAWVVTGDYNNQIAADMTGQHEGHPHGVPSSYDYYNGPNVNQGNTPPAGTQAMVFWGGLYVDSTNPNSPANTRVDVYNANIWILSKSTGTWSHPYTWASGSGVNQPDSQTYSEDFTGGPFASLGRVETDGTVSYVAGANQGVSCPNSANTDSGCLSHFYAPFPRVPITATDIGGIVVEYSAKLILANPLGPDDRGSALYLLDAGGDYYPSTTGGGIENNPGIMLGKFKYVTIAPQSFAATTLTQAQLEANPPPGLDLSALNGNNTNGALPPGLILSNTSGQITGTPTASGTSTFQVTYYPAVKPLSITIAPTSCIVNTQSLPAATIGTAYGPVTLTQTGCSTSTWTVSTGALPPGLSLNSSTGVISGTPTGSAGLVSFFVTYGPSNPVQFSINVSGTCAITSTSPLPNGTVGISYTYTFTQQYCSGSWSISSGSPPPGLNLSSGSGVLSGTPSSVGTTTFTVTIGSSSLPFSVTMTGGSGAPPFIYDPMAPQPADSFTSASSGAATVTWYHDNLYRFPAYGALPGQTLYGVLSVPATATAYGTLADGTLSTIDSTHIKFVANSNIVPVHDVEGLQPMPNDFVFYTSVAGLPVINQHYLQDGTNSCGETSSPHNVLCQGNPLNGTGWYQAVAPPNSTCQTSFGGTVYNGNPGASAYGGSPVGGGWTANFDCHPVFPYFGIVFGPTSQATILNPQNLTTQMKNTVYPSYNGPYPNVALQFNELREGGNFVNPTVNCNNNANGPGTDIANPPYQNCTPGGSQPFYLGSGGIDSHAFEMDPLGFHTFELYNDRRFGSITHCQSLSYTCNLASGRTINWYNYIQPVTAIGLAGLPQNQVEETVMELAKASIDPVAYPIQHAFSMIEPIYSTGQCNAVFDVWPAQYYAATSVNPQQCGSVMGERKVLDSTRANMTGLYSVTQTNAGSGYTPGAVITGTVSGCTSIDGINPAQVNAFIGQSGSVNSNSGINYLWIVNTGKNCISPTVTFPPPTSGTTITATLTTWASFTGAEANMLTALYNQLTQYGAIADDKTGGSSEVFRIEASLNFPQNNTYRAPMAVALPGRTSGFSNPMLWNWINESSIAPTATGWPTNMKTYPNGSWMTDATNATVGSSVQHQNVVRLTTTTGSIVSMNPIPVLGTSINFTIGNLSNTLNIVGGMTINLNKFVSVTGDPTSSGVSWSFITDPCSGNDTLTSTGTYTSCASLPGTSNAVQAGQMKLTSLFNPNVFTYVWVYVLPPFDSNGFVSIDIGGSGGCVNGSSFTSGVACSGPGTTWIANCQSCLYRTSQPGGQTDSSWPYTDWGNTPSAPLAVKGESQLYQGFLYSDPDITSAIVVPNGNYMIRAMVGEPATNFSTGSGPGKTIPPAYTYYYQSTVFSGGGYPQYWSYCVFCSVNFQPQTPSDVMIPDKVTDNILRYGEYGYSDPNWLGWDAAAHGGNPIYSILSAFQIRQDTTTPPHWVIGSYVPGAPGGIVYDSGSGIITGRGDNFTIPISTGTAYSTKGAPMPGILQLYIRDYFTGLGSPSTLSTDAVWSIVSGPGTLNASTGLFTAPTTQPGASNYCTVVKAQSASTPSISAQQTICYSGATHFIYK